MSPSSNMRIGMRQHLYVSSTPTTSWHILHVLGFTVRSYYPRSSRPQQPSGWPIEKYYDAHPIISCFLRLKALKRSCIDPPLAKRRHERRTTSIHTRPSNHASTRGTLIWKPLPPLLASISLIYQKNQIRSF